jgi:hypothetical protein
MDGPEDMTAMGIGIGPRRVTSKALHAVHAPLPADGHRNLSNWKVEWSYVSPVHDKPLRSLKLYPHRNTNLKFPFDGSNQLTSSDVMSSLDLSLWRTDIPIDTRALRTI